MMVYHVPRSVSPSQSVATRKLDSLPTVSCQVYYVSIGSEHVQEGLQVRRTVLGSGTHFGTWRNQYILDV